MKNADFFANLNSLRWVKKGFEKTYWQKNSKVQNPKIFTFALLQYFAKNFYLGHFLKSILTNLESA